MSIHSLATHVCVGLTNFGSQTVGYPDSFIWQPQPNCSYWWLLLLIIIILFINKVINAAIYHAGIKEAMARKATSKATLCIESQRSVEVLAAGPADQCVVVLTCRGNDQINTTSSPATTTHIAPFTIKHQSYTNIIVYGRKVNMSRVGWGLGPKLQRMMVRSVDYRVGWMKEPSYNRNDLRKILRGIVHSEHEARGGGVPSQLLGYVITSFNNNDTTVCKAM